MNEALCCLNYRVFILMFTSAGPQTFICVNVFCICFRVLTNSLTRVARSNKSFFIARTMRKMNE